MILTLIKHQLVFIAPWVGSVPEEGGRASAGKFVVSMGEEAYAAKVRGPYRKSLIPLH
jgi:hypothetical protein